MIIDTANEAWTQAVSRSIASVYAPASRVTTPPTAHGTKECLGNAGFHHNELGDISRQLQKKSAMVTEPPLSP